MTGTAALAVAPVQVIARPAPGRLQRCGGRTCPPGTCDHDGALPLRRLPASGGLRNADPSTGMTAALAGVPRLVASGGRPLPEATRTARDGWVTGR